jgi:exodeoxyribonuclease VII small subunit
MPSFPPQPGKPSGDPGSFEEQLAELEKLVDQLEHGDLTLEQSVSLFERGVHLSNACKEQLSNAESRVQVLLDPERKGRVQVEELALAVDEGEEESDDSESEEKSEDEEED